MPSLRELTSGNALPPYREGPPCQKCGTAGLRIRTWFCDGRRALSQASQSACYGEPREHMHRKCPTCQYEWLEAPRDAAAQP